MTQPLKPVFNPIYRVGRVGPEHAYVGDRLIKTPGRIRGLG
jgi:hypothetical protein